MGKEIFGWLTPAGKFIESKVWDHFKCIADNDDLKNLVPDYDVGESNVESARQGCEALSDEGEHPEWHSYEIAQSGFEYNVVEAVYKAGGVRVGSSSGSMYFDGIPDAIKNLYQKCKDLAEGYDMNAVFQPRKIL